MSDIRHHGLPASTTDAQQSPGFLKRMTQWPVCRSALKVSLGVSRYSAARNDARWQGEG